MAQWPLAVDVDTVDNVADDDNDDALTIVDNSIRQQFHDVSHVVVAFSSNQQLILITTQ